MGILNPAKTLLTGFLMASFSNVNAFVIEDSLLDGMGILVKDVVEKHMKGFNCVAWVDGGNASSSPLPLMSNSFIFIREDVKDDILLRVFQLKCEGWILQLRDHSAFLEKFEKTRQASLVRFHPRMLFLPLNQSTYARMLLGAQEFDYISDVIVVEIRNCSGHNLEIELFTNNFSIASGLNKERREISIGLWPLDESVELYPNKIQNLDGKDLRVATLQYLPYAMLSPALDGVEIRVMDAFCVAANCQLSPVTDDDLWGELYENGTSIGIVGNVLQDNADVGLGAVYLWYYEHIEFVFPYMPSKVTVLLPKPSPLPEWKVPIAPFDWVLWLSLLGSIVLAAIVLFLMNKCLLKYSRSHIPPREFESVSGIILRAVGMAVLQSPENIFTNGSTLRIALTTFQVFFLLYTTIYSSALSSVLTIPRYYPPIDNMRDLYLSGLPWAADHIAWVTTLKEADDPIIKGLLGNFAVFDQETLTVLSKKGGHGFTIELTNGGHVSEAAFLAADMINNLHTMKQPMYHTYSTMIIRKGSPYADELRKIVHRCIDTGLVQMWESMMLTSYGSSSIQTAFQLSKKSRSNEHTGLVKLKLLHTQGAFFILILGTVTGTIIFFMECFFHPRRGGFNGYRQDDVGGLGILVGLGYYA